MSIYATTLSQFAIEVLGQLFVGGPTWDGNIVSKSGRDELIRLGLSTKWEGGWNYLTGEGVQLAVWWAGTMSGDACLTERWYKKQRHQ